MPDIRAKVNELAESLPTPPKAAIHFVDPEDLGMKTMNDDAAAVADADWVMTWLPEGGMQKPIIEKFAGDLKEGAILTHACTIPTTEFKKIFDECGANVNVASYHPGAVPEMSSAVTAINYAGILAYRDTVTQILGAPAGFAQMMANEALTQVTALMQDEGIDKMDEALNPGALLGTADSMNFGPLAEIVPTVLENLEKRS